MTPTPVGEQQILDALRRVPQERWGTVLAMLTALQDDPSTSSASPIRTAADVLESGLIGVWADRSDIPDNREFARRLRHEAEHRRGHGDAAGH
jgi:hypothetical protein